MQTLEQQVEAILKTYPKARDNDNELFLCYLYCTGKIKDKLIATDSIREMPPLESLSRARRKLQETYPYLRGVNYKQRQAKQKDYINYNRS